MTLRDPVAAYNAQNNVEAHLIRNLLETNGVPAFVTEDVSVVGLWAMGTLPEIHKPQVWIERCDADRAKPLLDDFEKQESERRKNLAATKSLESGKIEVICDECGTTNSYPSTLDGSIQECRKCRSYLDVGDNNFTDEWQHDEPTSESDAV